MSTKHQKFEIEIPEEYTARERKAIAQDVIDRIVERTQAGKDKRGRGMKGYSESYEASLDFKIAGKKKGQAPDLTQSGDMLGALGMLAQGKGKLIIGYEEGSLENGIADGNIRGTYGQPKPVGPKRDFLGLTKRELREILDAYPLEDDGKRKRNSRVSEASRTKAKDVETTGDE